MENDSDQNHSNRTSNTIQAIDKKTVHQICSGQVVLDLATAVKELVENSVDAGATNIEIRLKEFGKELVEVSDNGEGIKESDFEALALKHYTSKLRQFNDLPSVSTFGFRGEALSSLSALGDLTITTHHASCEVGSKLTFNHDGKLADKGFAAREIGTTVCISNLFYTLPVRYKEFHRNYKKDFARLMNILYAFCLVNSTVRFSCINQVAKKKNLVLSSSGKNDTLNIISSIFGSNQVKNVIKIEQKEPTETILEEYNLSKKVCSEYANLFCLQGYISSITHGCGRSTSDRQFVFINKRPCDFPKLSRVINDVYHMFNRHQYPFVFLNISLNKDYVDVNVTPDKRQIMIQQENVLFVIVKSSLKFIFEHNSTCYVENNKSKDYAETPVNSTSISTFITSTPQSKSHEKNTDGEKLCENLLTPSSMSKKYSTDCSLGTILSSPLDRFRSKYEKPCLVKDASFVGKKTPDQCKLQSYFSSESKKRKQQSDGYIGSESKAKKAVFPSEENSFHASDDDLSAIPLNESNSSMNESMENNVMSDIEVKNFENETLCKNETNLMPHKNELHSVESRVDNEKEGLFNESKFEISISSAFEANHGAYDHHIDDGIDIKQSKCEHDDNVVIVDEIGIDKMFREKVVSSFNLAKLRENYSKYILDKSSKEESNLKVSSFRAKISTCDNQCAEEELGKNVTKEMFLLMDIIGQFNLGFIITKLNEDLFIVDQHASDEKYNYETLQQKHCLKGQRLIQPLPVKLTSVNEAILLENLEVFEKNGFEFDIKEETSSHEDNASRIHLLTVPTSRNWTFSIDDVEELVYLLGESPGMCRPSRVHKMFASRACRTSVMVGTALNKQKMRTLVKHMSEIDQPWNCPHGRPTMRHLINLERIQCND